MSFVKRIASGALNSTSATSFSATVGSNTSGSGSLVVAIGFGTSGGSVTSLTDTQANVYAKDFAADPGTTGGRGLEIWRCPNFRALTTSDTISVTLSSSQTNGGALVCDEFSFIGAQDASGSHYQSTTATTTSAPATILSDDIEAYSACIIFGPSQSPTVGATFTATGADQSGTAGNGVDLLPAYKDGPSAGSLTATYSWSASHTAVAVVLGFPILAGTAPAQGRQSVIRRHLKQRARAKVGPAVSVAGGTAGPPSLTAPVLPVAVAVSPVTLSGVVTVVQQVPGSSTYDYGWSTVSMTSTGGNTLIVLAGWDLSTQPVQAAMPAVNVVDSAGNYWIHAGTSPATVTGSRSAAFICVNAMPITWLSVSATTFVSSLAYTVAEVANMPLYCSLDAVAANAISSATSLTVSPGSAAAADLAFGVFTTGAAGLSPAAPSGWTALSTVTSGASGPNPVEIFPYWSPAASGSPVNATWTVAQAVPLSGVIFAIKAAPPVPVQPNPQFPVLKVEAGFGYTPGDPSQAPPAWTDITARAVSKAGESFISSTMGHQYELATAEAGELEIAIDNHDGAFTPGNTASPYYPNVVAGTPIHVSALWGGRWYHIGYGWVERWPQEWPDMPQWGMSKMIATDVVAVMASDTLPSALDGDMLLDSPYVFIQANEQYTSFQNGINPAFQTADAQGLLAANTSRVNQRAAAYVNGTAATAATGQTTSLLGDADTGFGTSSISAPPTASASGPGIIYTDPALPSPLSASGVTVEFWVIIPATVASTSLQPAVFSAFGPPSNYSASHPSLQVLINNFTGSNTLTVTLADGTTVTAPFNVSASAQQIVLAITAAALSIYVNGSLQATASLSAAQTTAWRAVTLGCCNYAYQSGSLTAGNFTAFDMAVYSCQLPVQRILSHYTTGFSGQQNVDATARIAQILSWGNIGIARGGQVLFAGIPDGVTQGPAYSLEGTTAADAVNQAALNHSAQAFGAPSGALTFLHKLALFNQAPAVIFGDSARAGDGEVPYLPAMSWDYDITYLYNVDKVTQQAGPNTTITVTAADFGSQASYFTRSALTQTIQTSSALDAYTQADWQIAKYAQPQLRVAGVTIDAAANPARSFPAVLPLQQGQVATTSRRPLGGAEITEAVLVQKIEHQIGPARWQTSYQLSPYTPEGAVLQLDTPGFDVIGGNTLA